MPPTGWAWNAWRSRILIPYFFAHYSFSPGSKNLCQCYKRLFFIGRTYTFDLLPPPSLYSSWRRTSWPRSELPRSAFDHARVPSKVGCKSMTLWANPVNTWLPGAWHACSGIDMSWLSRDAFAVVSLVRHLCQSGYPATSCYILPKYKKCAPTLREILYSFINVKYIINQAPRHGRIVTVGLCEFPKLSILVSNNIIFDLISASNMGSTPKVSQYFSCSLSFLTW